MVVRLPSRESEAEAQEHNAIAAAQREARDAKATAEQAQRSSEILRSALNAVLSAQSEDRRDVQALRREVADFRELMRRK